MKDQSKTRKVLIQELASLRQRTTDLEQLELKQRQVEAKLRESEERFRYLYEEAPSAYQSLDENGHFLQVNKTWLDTLGYKREEVLGKPFSTFLPPNGVGHFTQNFQKFKASGEIWGAEFEMVKKDGSTILVTLSGKISRDDQGRFTQTHCIFHDITERKQTQAALQATETLYRTLADSSQIATYIIQDKKLVFATPHLSRYAGDVTEDLLGKDMSAFIYPEDRERIRQKAVQMLKGETAIPYEYRIIDKQGQIRWLVETVSPITYHGRRATLGSAMDITEHKHMEKQLQDAKDQLAQSEKLAALGVLASGAAHEILNPLNILSMRLQMMQMMKYSEDEVKKSFEICKSQIDRIVKIVGGIRTFSYLPEKKQAEKKDLAEMMDHVLSLSASRIKEERVATEVHYDVRIPLLPLDEEAMEQVLFNLVSNALDVMKDKEERVLRVVTEKRGNKVLIVVSDTGTGVPPEILRKIFDPFFTTKGPGKGTGLGLSVSYGIIKGHGGRIWAENNEWGGASFFIELPTGESADNG